MNIKTFWRINRHPECSGWRWPGDEIPHFVSLHSEWHPIPYKPGLTVIPIRSEESQNDNLSLVTACPAMAGNWGISFFSISWFRGRCDPTLNWHEL